MFWTFRILSVILRVSIKWGNIMMMCIPHNMHTGIHNIGHWRDLNLAVVSQTLANKYCKKILADFNLAVYYRIAIHVTIFMGVRNFGRF